MQESRFFSASENMTFCDETILHVALFLLIFSCFFPEKLVALNRMVALIRGGLRISVILMLPTRWTLIRQLYLKKTNLLQAG